MSRATFFEVEVLDAKTRKQICFLDKVEPYSTIADIKSLVHKSYPQWYPARQALKLDPKAKALRDEEVLQSLPVGTTATMYFRDLGPQLGWTMVFLAEYMGPLFTYLMFYFRLPFIYPHRYAFTSSPLTVTTLACACHTGHYMKRLVETIFVHRFSHGTMPLRTIIRNCVYYWGFSAWLAYYINHPLYTPPYYGDLQINSACALFVLCEVGNFSIHLTLNSLKGEGMGPIYTLVLLQSTYRKLNSYKYIINTPWDNKLAFEWIIKYYYICQSDLFVHLRLYVSASQEPRSGTSPLRPETPSLGCSSSFHVQTTPTRWALGLVSPS
ncbi:very-long-chain enoyl-CoA reductase-like isoform X3 [Gadus macrocephalus]|uniref:very-long-chain enoyl-CoA reductase-like isoform X3 n=1 Tax=Gadus macrocephalus TaxID=80720 RepID=UPI0028CBBD4A|nr:very-long-chain enoyl-CoA reductase-like isoform X3 [Gadus macrocephalus]